MNLVENTGGSALTEFSLHSYPLSSWEDSLRAKVLLEMGSLYNGELGFYSCGDISFFEPSVWRHFFGSTVSIAFNDLSSVSRDYSNPFLLVKFTNSLLVHDQPTCKGKEGLAP